MTITLLDLYNEISSQPWSIYDNDAVSTDNFDCSLLSAINKALVEVWCSHLFEFRLRTKRLFLQSGIKSYDLPLGIIRQRDGVNGIRYMVKLNGRYLEFLEDTEDLVKSVGRPTGFYIEGNKLCFYPCPDKVYRVKIDYYTLAVGYDASSNPVYRLDRADDYIEIPEQYEQLFLNALISKTMMYALVDVSDENFAGYNVQYEKAYRALIKSLGMRKKTRRIGW